MRDAHEKQLLELKWFSRDGHLSFCDMPDGRRLEADRDGDWRVTGSTSFFDVLVGFTKTSRQAQIAAFYSWYRTRKT